MHTFTMQQKEHNRKYYQKQHKEYAFSDLINLGLGLATAKLSDKSPYGSVGGYQAFRNGIPATPASLNH